jgi:hypothetical protein
MTDGRLRGSERRRLRGAGYHIYLSRPAPKLEIAIHTTFQITLQIALGGLRGLI